MTRTLLAVVLVVMPGCEQLFDLESPVLRDATIDTADRRPTDAPVDGRQCPPAPNGCTVFTCLTTTSCYYSCGGGGGLMGSTSWDIASTRCAELLTDGCLVTIDSVQEQDCIIQNAAPGFTSALWIGFVQATPAAEPAGGWGWQCGASTFVAQNWGISEPNDSNNDEQCAGIIAGGAWFDAKCSDNHRFLCELE